MSLFQFFLLWSLHSRNGSFRTGVLITRRLPGLHAAIPWVQSSLPFSVLILPLCSYPRFSLILSTSVLVVFPFQTRSYQRTLAHCATLLPGMPLDVTQGIAALDNSHVYPLSVNYVLSGSKAADVSMLTFRDPDAFVAGYIQSYLPSGQTLLLSPVTTVHRTSSCGLSIGLSFTRFLFSLGEITSDSLTILVSLL